MDIDLPKLNSLTKYPSIPTYHGLDPTNGKLTDEVLCFRDPVVLTEKIDGTNGRIIFVGNDWFIGSREEILTAKGDRVFNPAQGIVEVLAPIAERIGDALFADFLPTFYFEVYGGKQLPAWKQYGNGTPSARLFDISLTNPAGFDMTREQIASWREHGGQTFRDEAGLQLGAHAYELNLVPRLHYAKGAVDLPVTIEEGLAFLEFHCTHTKAPIGDGAVLGLAEGIVVRSADRSCIGKMRFEDYRRTLNPQQGRRSRA